MYAPVAQLDRVTDYESVGRGFESLPAYQRRIIRTLLLGSDYFYAYPRTRTNKCGAGERRRRSEADSKWEQVKKHAKTCSWKAGRSLAHSMENDFFLDRERVIVALNCEEICGYCTVSKIGCIPNVPYSPYIGYVFVGEAHRGNRLSEKLIELSID